MEDTVSPKVYREELLLTRMPLDRPLRFAVVSKDGSAPAAVLERLLAAGHTKDDDCPDYVISYGGDGTLLGAERKYPGVPKLFIRYSKIGFLGQPIENEKVIDLFLKGEYFVLQTPKLAAWIIRKGKDRHSQPLPEDMLPSIVNEMVIAPITRGPATRVRIDIEVPPHRNPLIYVPSFEGTILGDVVLCSTPTGSTGYWKSAARSTFSEGIGLAVVASITAVDHAVLPHHTKIFITVDDEREAHICFADNDELERKIAQPGDTVCITGMPESESMRLIRVFH